MIKEDFNFYEELLASRALALLSKPLEKIYLKHRDQLAEDREVKRWRP